MRAFSFIVLTLLLASFLAAAYLILRGFGVLGEPSLEVVKNVPTGHQEIAWIAPATSGDAWERLVAAVRQLEKAPIPGLPGLRVSYDSAFLEVSAGVPELALWLPGKGDAKLWIRWYKVSSAIDAPEWVTRLARRDPPPLAVIGGDSSDRALRLARALEDVREQWRGAAPLFLITTATADRYFAGDPQNVDLTREDLPKLMDVYKGRSFRFSFTNRRMAEAVLDFVKDHPEVWPNVNRSPAVLSSVVSAPDAWTAAANLAATGLLQQPVLNRLAWSDDRYSVDLADRFGKLFAEMFCRGLEGEPLHRVNKNNSILYGVGDFYQPNPSEALAVGLFLVHNADLLDQPQLLALPTGTQRARRFLRALCRRGPLEVRNVVAITGDSISFNNIYRDRDVAWNIQDIPVPLVFFSHRNPIDPGAGFEPGPPREGQASSTSTQDLLLYRDILEALLQAAYQDGRLVESADTLGDRLWQTRWHEGRVVHARHLKSGAKALNLFDSEGNRAPGSGEHVVWLKPDRREGQVLAQAHISVWFLRNQGPGRTGWRQFGQTLEVGYD
jgi:hypothetical protein